jgi:hypothetical protein
MLPFRHGSHPWLLKSPSAALPSSKSLCAVSADNVSSTFSRPETTSDRTQILRVERPLHEDRPRSSASRQVTDRYEWRSAQDERHARPVVLLDVRIVSRTTERVLQQPLPQRRTPPRWIESFSRALLSTKGPCEEVYAPVMGMVVRPAARLVADKSAACKAGSSSSSMKAIPPSLPEIRRSTAVCVSLASAPSCVAQLRGSGPRAPSGDWILVGCGPVDRSALWNRPHIPALGATQIRDASEEQGSFHHCEALALEAHSALRLRAGGGWVVWGRNDPSTTVGRKA